MKKITFKRGSVNGTALRLVATFAFCGSLLYGGHSYIEQGKKLDKAESKIVQNEESLKHQYKVISDATNENEKLLKDNAKLNQKLKSEIEENSRLQQKLEQTELQARELEEALRKK